MARKLYAAKITAVELRIVPFASINPESCQEVHNCRNDDEREEIETPVILPFRPISELKVPVTPRHECRFPLNLLDSIAVCCLEQCRAIDFQVSPDPHLLVRRK